MANEAIQVEGPYEAHDFTVATGTAVPQYTLMQLTDPRTATASDGDNLWAGIAATEKTATDGVTNLGLFTTGTFLLTASGATIPDGAIVSLSGANFIKQATEAEMVTGAVVGKALQDIAGGSTGEVKIGVVA